MCIIYHNIYTKFDIHNVRYDCFQNTVTATTQYTREQFTKINIFRISSARYWIFNWWNFHSHITIDVEVYFPFLVVVFFVYILYLCFCIVIRQFGLLLLWRYSVRTLYTYMNWLIWFSLLLFLMFFLFSFRFFVVSITLSHLLSPANTIYLFLSSTRCCTVLCCVSIGSSIEYMLLYCIQNTLAVGKYTMRQ